MANVKTFNLSVYLPFIPGMGRGGKTITFRGISRVAVERYKKYYTAEYTNGTTPTFHVEAR
jgi:hypothetical protein